MHRPSSFEIHPHPSAHQVKPSSGHETCALFDMLARHAAAQGHSLEQLARTLGVPLGQVTLMRAGVHTRMCRSDAFLQACSTYLGASLTELRVRCDQMPPEDIDKEAPAVAEMLPHAIRQIGRSDQFGAYLPQDIYEASPALQLLLVKLYEAATGTHLLHGRVATGAAATPLPHVVRSELGH